MDINNFFIKHQKIILEFVNYFGGKELLGIDNDEVVYKVTPNSYHILKNVYKDTLELQAKFYTGNNIAVKLYPYILREIFSLRSFHPMSFNISTISLDTGSARVLDQNISSWAQARADSSGTLVANDQSYSLTSQPGSGTARIDRSFFPFLTASLGITAVITAATVDLYRDDSFGTFANADSDSIDIVTTTQASTTTLATSDYSNIANVSKGNATLASTSNGATKNITVTNLTIISSVAVSKLGARLHTDLSNTTPSGSNAIAASGAHATTLTVTYTIPGGLLLGGEI